MDYAKDGDKLLKEYPFLPNDGLVFLERNRGGSTLQPLEGQVSPTKESCCVTGEDDPTEWRCQLECGHTVGKWNIFIWRSESIGISVRFSLSAADVLQMCVHASLFFSLIFPSFLVSFDSPLIQLGSGKRCKLYEERNEGICILRSDRKWHKIYKPLFVNM